MPLKLGRGRGRGSAQQAMQPLPALPQPRLEAEPGSEGAAKVDSLLPSTHRQQPSLSTIGNEVRDGCHSGNHPQNCATMGHEGHRTIPVAAVGLVLMEKPPLCHTVHPIAESSL